MKKLLGLLGTMTIAGSGMTGIVGNVPAPTKNEINYSQKNNLKNLSRSKRQNNENNIFGIKKIVINTNSTIYNSGVTLNNKVYFGSADHNIYEYNPITGQQKIVIQTNGLVQSSGVILNNKLYFGSLDHNVYEYNPATGQQKIVIQTNGEVWSSGKVLNNKVYFGSGDNNVYEYDPTTGQQKIVIKAEKPIWSSGVVLNNKVYFGSQDNNVYEYDPTTGKQKIVIQTNGTVHSSGVTLNNKVYFGSADHNVYEYDPVTEQQKIVITTKSGIDSSGVVLNNKVYFGSDDTYVYEYDPTTAKQKIVIKTNHWVRSSGAVLNNKVYFGSHDKNVYQYDPATGQQKIVFQTNGHVDSSGIVLNNKLYIGSWDHNVYEYSNYYLHSNLKEIINNSDNLILNELNYLNPDLNISQLKIINKTDKSAIIKSKDNKDFDEFVVNYKIKNKDEVSSINLNELIKKAIFFKFRDENPNLKFKEIKDIDTNNLNFSNVEVTKKENSFSWFRVEKIICPNKKFINNTTSKKLINLPACVYDSKYKITFQLLTGLINKNQENKLNGWNISSDDETKLTKFINANYNANTEIINKLSNEFDLSNISKQKQEIIIHSLNEINDNFYINPNEKLQVNYSPLKISKYKNMLNLKQNIMGTIIAKIVISSDKEKIITLSIKEAMQILQNYNLLPNEITINEDNNITFNGKAHISSEIEGAITTNIETFIE